MKEDFYKKVIISYDIEVVTPSEDDMKEIDRVIFKELVLSKTSKVSKEKYIEIINNLCLKDKKIDSVILGCTKISLLVKKDDINLKIFDTTALHVKGALAKVFE